MDRPDSVLRIRCVGEGFFEEWMKFLRPFHLLPASETRIAGKLLAVRDELSGKISDEALVDRALFSIEGKAEVCRRCGIKPTHLQVVLGKFRKCGFVSGERVNLNYVPRRRRGSDNYTLLMYFAIEGDGTADNG